MDDSLLLHAQRFGLSVVDPNQFDVERRPHGKGFRICFSKGDVIHDQALKERIKALVIPPAWTNVRICIDETGHIQAVGRDEKNRLQYRYHDAWVNVRNAVKTERLIRFGNALPALRARVAKDLRRKRRDRLMTAALATRLIDLAAMRPGHEKYAADGGRGVASLRKTNLRIVGKTAILKFIGKSKKLNRVELTDKSVVKGLKLVRRAKGQRLFKFLNERRKGQRKLTATLLNEYLHEASGASISTKDFRTFHGSAEALRFLIEDVGPLPDSERKRRKAVAAAMRSVSERLRNTPAVARSSYVHPQIVEAYESGTLDADLLKGRKREGLTRPETGLMRFLERID